MDYDSLTARGKYYRAFKLLALQEPLQFVQEVSIGYSALNLTSNGL